MVGRAVAARLAELGVDVVGASRSGEAATIVLDAADPPPLEPVIAGADIVVNAIGVLRSAPDYPGDAYRLRATLVNAVFPSLLARAAAKQGTRVVHISTDAVFASLTEPADETAEISPREPYGLTKALGETDAPQVVNVRCSVVGPAPGRPGGLWEWLAKQPRGAEVPGFDTRWSGASSRQLAVLCGDLLDRAAFEGVRTAGATHHFVPNEPTTKFQFLCRLAEAVRPDVTVVETRGEPGRELVTSTGALDSVFSGTRGWTAALAEITAGT
jgi:dTDP-4-dehydrorhamnose reductase